eukprot:CAMPEP_0180611728 /NCGR_PEP_ID=MMETSP1037_2-20121125/29987_1 /TAXON_ID=632150 /ORGANISM="Azadinium spinosum, Strain 3D9" /LENGTH=101 /DNA_ID=CAMNT_0022631291 /DNA_START=76 /DNA_END=377 /DNA_ORIENTATION=+
MANALLGSVTSADQNRMAFTQGFVDACGYKESTYGNDEVNHDVLLTSIGCSPPLEDPQMGEPIPKRIQAEADLRSMPNIQAVHGLLGFGTYSHVFSCTVEG